MTNPPESAPCPICAAPASGRFCSNCGASLAGATCASCGTALTPGARFCHRCGTAVGTAGAAARPVAAPPPASAGPGAEPGVVTYGAPAGARDVRGTQSKLPWAVAGVAFVALIALLLGQRVARPLGAAGDVAQTAPGSGDAQDAPGAGAPGAPVAGGPMAAIPAQCRSGGAMPSLAGMSEREQAERLFDRVMRLKSEREADSSAFAAANKDQCIQFFGMMAIRAYTALPERDPDVRFDMGRIAIVSGAPELARVEADSILAQQPTHLLGLILAAEAARGAGDAHGARDYERRLVAAAPAEQRRRLPEYDRHSAEIEAAIAQAQRK